MIFRRVLIAVDSGPVAAHAVDIGLDLANALGAEVALAHVVGLPPPGDTGIPPAELERRAREEGAQLLAGIHERKALSLAVQNFLESGGPAAEIIKAAKACPADMIVMGSHGRRGVQRVLLGSVAEATIRHAPCPVLVVRAA